MWGTQVAGSGPRRRSARLVQFAPSSRVSWTLPSSVPTQITPRWSGLGAIVRIVVWFSAPVPSFVMPPDSSYFCFSGSFVVRSGDSSSHAPPWSRLRCRNCEP